MYLERIILCLVALWAAAGLAQGQDGQTFRTTTELARLEVSVVDRDRRPVTGLTAGDFILTIAGTSEPVVLAEEVSAAPPNHRERTSRNSTTNDIDGTRLFAIILDDAQTPAQPFMMRAARDSALEVVRSLLPTDLATVVYTWDVQKGQEFTSDRRKLETAIDRFRPGSGSPLAPVYARRTLRGVVDALHALPAHQRSIVLISPGIAIDSSDRFARLGSPDSHILDSNFEGDNILQAGAGDRRLARIPIYAVDVAGLLAPTDARTGRSAAVAVNRAGPDWLKMLATQSGGLAITENNNPLPAVRRMIKDTESYYVLGFRPLSALSRQKIELRVRNRPGATVMIRQYSADATQRPAATLERAIAGFLPLSGVQLQMVPRVLPPINGKSQLVVSVRVGSLPGETEASETLDVEWRVFDEWKEVHASRRVIGRDEMVVSGGHATFFIRTVLGPGRYHLRLAVRGEGWRSAASVFGDVSIRGSDSRADISDPFLFASSRRIKSPRSISDLVSAAPDFDQIFDAGEDVHAAVVMKFANSDASHHLVFSVLAADGSVAHQQRIPVSNRCLSPCGYSGSIGVARLPPGRYQLKVALEGDSVVPTREALFWVR